MPARGAFRAFADEATPRESSSAPQSTVPAPTNTEEEAAGLTKVVPSLVEDALKVEGGIFSRAEDWKPARWAK